MGLSAICQIISARPQLVYTGPQRDIYEYTLYPPTLSAVERIGYPEHITHLPIYSCSGPQNQTTSHRNLGIHTSMQQYLMKAPDAKLSELACGHQNRSRFFAHEAIWSHCCGFPRLQAIPRIHHVHQFVGFSPGENHHFHIFVHQKTVFSCFCDCDDLPVDVHI